VAHGYQRSDISYQERDAFCVIATWSRQDCRFLIADRRTLIANIRFLLSDNRYLI
jgi:hypothetical protein